MQPIQANNILITQLRQVGDVLLATPAVKVLRAWYPHSRISFLTETVPAVLLQGNPHLDVVLIRNPKGGLRQDSKLLRAIRAARYDLVIDFFCNPRSAWLSLFTGAPYRIANYHAGRAWCYTHTPVIPDENRYAAEDKLALLRAIGVTGALHPPIIRVTAEAKRYIDNFFRGQGIIPGGKLPIISIDATSRRQARRWRPERYAQLADRLAERYAARVIFIWGPGEKEFVQALVARGQCQHLLACPTDLMQLAALLAQSHLHVGNCSAPRHIAVAVGTPSLTIMGPTSPAHWTFPAPQHQVIQGNVPCLGCQQRACQTHECMNSLTVEEVEQAAVQLLRGKT